MSAVQPLSRAFGVLSHHGIGVHMATTSEATVSMVTDQDYSAGQGIKAKMVSQSASEINIAFLVDNSQIEPAVRALHSLIVKT